MSALEAEYAQRLSDFKAELDAQHEHNLSTLQAATQRAIQVDVHKFAQVAAAPEQLHNHLHCYARPAWCQTSYS